MSSNREIHRERCSESATFGSQPQDHLTGQAGPLRRGDGPKHKAQARLVAFLRDVDRIKVHDEDDSAFENELEDYRNDSSDGVTSMHPRDFFHRERSRLNRLLAKRHKIFSSARSADSAPFKFRIPSRGSPSGVKRPRNFALREKRLPTLRAEFARTRRVPNPYNVGCYHFIIEALKALGANRAHRLIVFRAKIEELMGPERWRIFACREGGHSRPKEVPDVDADVDARLHYNCRVLQRTKDYGLKLLQVGRDIMGRRGCVIDILGWGENTKYRLNTNAEHPRYDAKRLGRRRDVKRHARRPA